MEELEEGCTDGVCKSVGQRISVGKRGTMCETPLWSCPCQVQYAPGCHVALMRAQGYCFAQEVAFPLPLIDF